MLFKFLAGKCEDHREQGLFSVKRSELQTGKDSEAEIHCGHLSLQSSQPCIAPYPKQGSQDYVGQVTIMENSSLILSLWSPWACRISFVERQLTHHGYGLAMI